MHGAPVVTSSSSSLTLRDGRIPSRGALPDLLARHVAAHCPEGCRIFTGECGERPHQNSIAYRWRTTLRSAGLAGVKLHDLRLFDASGLIASG